MDGEKPYLEADEDMTQVINGTVAILAQGTISARGMHGSVTRITGLFVPLLPLLASAVGVRARTKPSSRPGVAARAIRWGPPSRRGPSLLGNRYHAREISSFFVLECSVRARCGLSFLVVECSVRARCGFCAYKCSVLS